MLQPTMTPRYADRVSGMQASEIRELLKIVNNPGIISFAGGIPDPALFPLDQVRAAYSEVLASDSALQSGLQYSISEGDAELREWIAAHMKTLGVDCTADNILITNGAQQGLEFLGKLFISPGDEVLVAAPTYLGALQAFAQNEPRYATFKANPNGTVEVTPPEATGGTGRTGFMYVVPDFANPSGETIGEQGRLGVLDIATARKTMIVEDSPYEMLRFDGLRQPSIQSLDIERCGSIDNSRVIHCGSFSKVFMPGLRVGWICARQDVISKLVLIKQSSDLNASAINQRVVLSLARTQYAAQVEKACAHYRARRDAMLESLPAYLPEGSQWTKPDGGMFIWVELPEGYDTAALLPKASHTHGVAYVPGAAFFADGAGRNTMRLSYSLPGPDDIRTGCARLGAALA